MCLQKKTFSCNYWKISKKRSTWTSNSSGNLAHAMKIFVRIKMINDFDLLKRVMHKSATFSGHLFSFIIVLQHSRPKIWKKLHFREATLYLLQRLKGTFSLKKRVYGYNYCCDIFKFSAHCVLDSIASSIHTNWIWQTFKLKAQI